MSFPKIIYTENELFGKYWGFAFFLWIWVYKSKESEGYVNTIINHETIHYIQQKELGFIIMWILYVYFYLVNLLIYFNHEESYRNNPFEAEAYANQYDKDYLNKRRPYSWIYY